MIEIKKGNEPKELLQYRQQDFASYADMPSDVKKKVINLSIIICGRSFTCITERRMPFASFPYVSTGAGIAELSSIIITFSFGTELITSGA